MDEAEQKRKERTRGKTREIMRARLMSFYLRNNHDEPPLLQVEDRRGKVLYYHLEPLLPERELNVALVEYPIGDGYAFAFEPFDQAHLGHKKD